MGAPAPRPAVSDARAFVARATAASGRITLLRQRVTRVTGLTASGMVLAGVAVSAWLIGFLAAGKPLYLVAYGVAAVLVAAWLLVRRPLPLTGARSAARARLREGEVIAMQVSFTARRRLRTFILEEQLPPLLGQDARLPVAAIGPGESATESYTVTCWRRGVYQLGPLRARAADPFGLVERATVLAEPFELLVHPGVEPVQDRPLTRLWEDPPVRPPVSKPWPSGMEFYGMRKYVPGDDVRKVVWKVFGRTRELMVREAEQGITDRMVIVLDADSRRHSEGVISESFEAACRVVASLGVQHLKDGYSVTLEGNARRLAGPLRGGGPARIALLDELARATVVREPLAGALLRIASEPGRDAHMVVVTPYLEPDAASRLKLLLERGMHLVVVAILWDELAAETLGVATALGAQVVEVRPGTPLARAFRQEIGAGRR